MGGLESPVAPSARVGNDVVDLQDPEIADRHRSERFLRRVLADEEHARVVGASDASDAIDAKALLWTLFAAKEAAYKLAMKLGPRPVLGHRSFVVAEDLRSVRHGDRVFELSVTRTADLVHAVAFVGGEPELTAVAEAPGRPAAEPSGAEPSAAEPSAADPSAAEPSAADPSAAEPSAAVRALLASSLSVQLGVDAAEIVVTRDPLPGSWDGYGPPRVTWGRSTPARDVSLSHHGRFVAFALGGPVWTRGNDCPLEPGPLEQHR
ncbi:MAG: 4'-phosphopantetheinyl transferase superfamily protein [Deltaproteobacteria bacterium]|nr:4'-phosphopantetheinyl transferase superfamily protein [Deltaproteobacteria bacterium]